MIQTNLPVLYRNALPQYEGETLLQSAWLWFADNHSKCQFRYDADSFADKVRSVVSFIRPVTSKAAGNFTVSIPEQVLCDLEKFMLKRLIVHLLGRNVAAWWETGK